MINLKRKWRTTEKRFATPHRSKLISYSLATTVILYKYLRLFVVLYWCVFFSQNNKKLKNLVLEKKYRPSILKRANVNNKIDLSIIIPIYNVEKYINECLLSVFKQKTQYTYEVIAINDHSTDDSLTIINNFKHKDNLKIINLNSNIGLSGARNKGLESATGKYLFFLDSDDLLCIDAVQHLIELAYHHEADVVEVGILNFQCDEQIIIPKTDYKIIIANNSVDINNNAAGFAAGKIYNRSLFENINFPEGLVFEDGIIRKIILRLANKYVRSTKHAYLYRNNPESISNTTLEQKYGLDHFEMISYCVEEYYRLFLKPDMLLYKQLLRESTFYLNKRASNFQNDTKRHMLSECKKLLIKVENDIQGDTQLTIIEKIARFSIYNIHIKVWEAVSEFM